jgi:hypothetical protein
MICWRYAYFNSLDVPVEMAAEEKAVAKTLKRIGKFYVILREVRAELFDDEFQAELAKAYQPRGKEPKDAALLAMVTLLQAYDRTGDAEAVISAAMDKRWQLVLDCLGAKKAPFSQGLLPQFRERMIEHGLDQKLLDRTVELAKRTGKFGWQHLKAALDSSPLLGAGRVLDTWNLIGRALSTVVTCAAKVTGRTKDEVLAEAEMTLLSQPSLKVALDINWDDDAQRADALDRLLKEVDRLEQWVATHAASQAAEPPLCEALQALRRVLAQDIEPDPTTGRLRIRRGVTKDRMPSLGDPQMRHGRKSKKHPFTGYKRHFVKVLEPDIIIAAEVLSANQPEQDALGPLVDEVEQHGSLEELFLDRGYLGSPRISKLRDQGVTIRCKPSPSRNKGRFAKDVFDIRLAEHRVVCPAGQSAKISSLSNILTFQVRSALGVSFASAAPPPNTAAEASPFTLRNHCSLSCDMPPKQAKDARICVGASGSSTPWPAFLRFKVCGRDTRAFARTPSTLDARLRSPTSKQSSGSGRPHDLSVQLSRDSTAASRGAISPWSSPLTPIRRRCWCGEWFQTGPLRWPHSHPRRRRPREDWSSH